MWAFIPILAYLGAVKEGWRHPNRTLCSGVVGTMDFSKALLINMGINLGCRDVGMPQKLLNDPQVSSVLQKVGCEGVAQEVGVDFLGESRLGCPLFDDLPDPVGAQGAPADRKKNLGGTSGFDEVGAFVLEIVLECFARPAADGNNTGFVALSGNPEKAVIKVQSFQPDGADLGKAKAG